jgi:hypothetical protein
MRVSRAHTSMEGYKSLMLPLFCGVDAFLEEATLISGRTCTCHIALRTISLER